MTTRPVLVSFTLFLAIHRRASGFVGAFARVWLSRSDAPTWAVTWDPIEAWMSRIDRTRAGAHHRRLARKVFESYREFARRQGRFPDMPRKARSA